ncbi:E3 ubiquitin-protein ligase TM129 isoform X2 [Epargyreus clarus]|uniref:E3 ubiquitin-protein ligase TM129 isoform X2 n=1 Tax=Epargyreus clarus TaxID=520877 RepID=UPI003C2F2C68
MDVLISLFYALFSICVIYPPTEFVSAGFTIPQIFDGCLGSENTNFITYHMKRIAITAMVHAMLPLGYVFSLWMGGEDGPWMLPSALFAALMPTIMCLKVVTWWDHDKINHPVVRALLPYVTEGSDWRVVASDFNFEYRGVDKVVIALTATSKFIATQTWLIKVGQYSLDLAKQNECALVATATDNHAFSQSGEDEIQYVNIEVIPNREDVKRFSFRISATALRDLQPSLQRPVRVPEHISLLPTLVERFVKVFKQHVEQNPVYYSEQEIEQCIGCMQAQADVKLDKRCVAPAPPGAPPCQPCNCRVLWCCACMARWWATRAGGPASRWLGARGSCPVCRAPFCLADVRPARIVPPARCA